MSNTTEQQEAAQAIIIASNIIRQALQQARAIRPMGKTAGVETAKVLALTN